MSKDDAFERFEFPQNINTLKSVFTPIEPPKQSNILVTGNTKSEDKSPKRQKKREIINFTEA